MTPTPFILACAVGAATTVGAMRSPSPIAQDTIRRTLRLRMKTLNGGLYTDFDVTVMPSAPVVAERRNGTFVYRNDRFAAVRVGRGGPQITFEGVNGDVHVLRGDN
jgi:hypothetical protein